MNITQVCGNGAHSHLWFKALVLFNLGLRFIYANMSDFFRVINLSSIIRVNNSRDIRILVINSLERLAIKVNFRYRPHALFINM